MGPCEQNADRWLDHLYGLLNEAESQDLTVHLTDCPVCQASLADARRDQARMARAACPFLSIPEFKRPQEARHPLRVPALGTVRQPPVTLPMPTAPKPRRALARRIWPMYAAAAVALVVVFASKEWYRRGAEEREQAVALVKKQLQAVETQFAGLKLQTAADQRDLVHQAKVETLQLHVLGPNQVHADAPYNCRIATRDLDGQPLPAQLEVRLVRTDSDDVIHRQVLDSKGDVELHIPAGLKWEKGARLEVAANHGTIRTELRETLQAAPTAHLLHLAMNKSVYQLGEVVFFRAVALERFSLKPATASLPLRFRLINSLGKTALEAEIKTTAGGIASGEFALLPNLPSGAYTVQVSAADPALSIQAQSQGVDIVQRLSDLDVRPDQKIYRAGDKIILHVTARGDDGQALKNQMIKFRADLGKSSSGAVFTPARSLTDAEGKATIQFNLPKEFEGSQVNVNFELPGLKKDVRDSSKTVRSIRVVPSRLEVDLYPEGGDLVAGVPQRVFYRVRTPDGATATPEGPLTLRSSQGVLYEAKDRKSLGSFTVTPDPQETYVLHVPVNRGVSEIKNPFARLGMKSEGAVVHVAKSVTQEGDALRIELRHKGPDRNLMLVASCRGQIVAQQFVLATASQIEMKIPSGVRGIVRLTLYEVRDQTLIPCAERLVYRAPAQRLDMKATSSNVRGGESTRIKVETRDEQGKPAQASALVMVVDNQYRLDQPERDLAGHFLLSGEFGPDLAEAPLLGDDTAATTASLELFLGTYGWRRFVPQADSGMIAQAEPAPTMFSSANVNPEQLRAEVLAKVERNLGVLRKRVGDAQARLAEEREGLAGNLAAAVQARGDHDRLPSETLRIGAGLLVAVAFLASLVWLSFGMVRVVRRQAAAANFAGALGILTVCLVVYLSAGSLAEVEGVRPGNDLAGGPAFPPIQIALGKELVKAPVAPVVGKLALASSPLPKNPSHIRPAVDLAGALVMADPAQTPAPSKFVQHPQMQERFQAAAQAQQTSSRFSPEQGREFAHRQYAGFDAQPTLLWHPHLRLEKGQANVTFDIPAAPATYRVLIYGHSDDGRLGFVENRLEVPSKK